jgi:hypothetical protein
MENSAPEKISMASPACYSVTIKGNLPTHWAVWFNGSTIQLASRSEGGPHTVLTCRVKDQAELLGILNQLNSLNLPLLEVKLLQEEDCR